MALSSRQYGYDVISLDLSTARSDVAQGLTNKINQLTVSSLDGGSLSVKLNKNTNDSITLEEDLNIGSIPITELYWTNTAQAGKTVYIFVVWVD